MINRFSFCIGALFSYKRLYAFLININVRWSSRSWKETRTVLISPDVYVLLLVWLFTPKNTFFYLFQFYFWRKKGANNKRQWNRTFVVNFFNITGSYVVIYRGGAYLWNLIFFYHTENNLWTSADSWWTIYDCRWLFSLSILRTV